MTESYFRTIQKIVIKVSIEPFTKILQEGPIRAACNIKQVYGEIWT